MKEIKGKSKVQTSDLLALVAENIELRQRNEILVDRLATIKAGLITSIEDEATKKIQRAKDTGERQWLMSVDIEKIAELADIDWDFYFEDWEEQVNKARAEYEKNNN